MYNNIYLFSNDPLLCNDKINTLLMNDDKDLLVLFNHANPLKYKKIIEFQNKWLMLNNHKNGFWGYESAITNSSKYKKLIFNQYIYSKKHIEQKMILTKLFRDNCIIDNYRLYVSDYTKKRIPTIGYIAYHYITQTLRYNKIFLVNFTGKFSDARQYTNDYFHDYSFEQNFYKTNNITIL